MLSKNAGIVNYRELAQKYGTPLMLLDETGIRNNCKMFRQLAQKHFGITSKVLYASKALCFKALYPILQGEGMGIDVVSRGEIHTAKSAGINMSNAYFHGSNKTEADIQFAIQSGVGCIVANSLCEARMISRIATTPQTILLRLTPSVDACTHKSVNTGLCDSKFGVHLENADAQTAVREILQLPNLVLLGFHYHIGSQIFTPEPFICAAKIVVDFVRKAKTEFGFVTQVLNIGGGFGVRYVDTHPTLELDNLFAQIAKVVDGIPTIMIEPGRAIVAQSGTTLYTVGVIKEIEGVRNFVSVDGGMTDNPRYALYQSPYTIFNASRIGEDVDYTATIAGCACESGDLIAEHARIAEPTTGDILAVTCTGAYNYSMASNYNRMPRPPIVMIGTDGTDSVVVRRETLDDLCRLDV